MRSTERDNNESMIGRVSTILRAYMHNERELSISELSRRTGIPKATTSRIANSLVEYGFLERDGDAFRLGIRLFELGQQASRSTDLRKLSFPFMSELMTATRQTVHLAMLEGNEVVYIQILRSKSSPPLPSRVGGRLPAHATGVGKVLLAYSDDAQLESLFSTPLEKIGPRTITERSTLEASLQEIREHRLGYEREESAENLGCAAAPILGPTGQAIAAISVSVHLDHVDLAKMGPAVSTTARALSRQLGAVA